MEGGSLEEVIGDRVRLTWRRRLEVAADVARTLVFLHHECSPAVVHRDVKVSNVLLDGSGKARVADFGLARAVGEEQGHMCSYSGATRASGRTFLSGTLGDDREPQGAGFNPPWDPPDVAERDLFLGDGGRRRLPLDPPDVQTQQRFQRQEIPAKFSRDSSQVRDNLDDIYGVLRDPLTVTMVTRAVQCPPYLSSGYSPHDGRTVSTYKTDSWDSERYGPDSQPGGQFDLPVEPKTLEDLEMEFKSKAIELERIWDKE